MHLQVTEVVFPTPAVKNRCSYTFLFLKESNLNTTFRNLYKMTHPLLGMSVTPNLEHDFQIISSSLIFALIKISWFTQNIVIVSIDLE